MSQQHNLGFRFLQLAAAEPDRPAIVAGSVRISHGQMRQIVILMALHMQRLGIGPTSTVAPVSYTHLTLPTNREV